MPYEPNGSTLALPDKEEEAKVMPMLVPAPSREEELTERILRIQTLYLKASSGALSQTEQREQVQLEGEIAALETEIARTLLASAPRHNGSAVFPTEGTKHPVTSELVAHLLHTE